MVGIASDVATDQNLEAGGGWAECIREDPYPDCWLFAHCGQCNRYMLLLGPGQQPFGSLHLNSFHIRPARRIDNGAFGEQKKTLVGIVNSFRSACLGSIFLEVEVEAG